jgi:hypothetical protein
LLSLISGVGYDPEQTGEVFRHHASFFWAAISFDVRERAPMQAVRYFGFADPSGGSGDSFSLAIGHKEKDVVVLDALRERRPPFSPEDVVAEFSELLQSYRISKITGDRYAGEWPVEQFRKHGIAYEAAPKPKNDLYRDMTCCLSSTAARSICSMTRAC